MTVPAMAFYLMPALMLPLLLLYTALPIRYARVYRDLRIGKSKKLFCFCHALMMLTFSYLYGRLLAAPYELAHPQLWALPALICTGVTLVMGVLFFRTLSVKLPELFSVESLDHLWSQLLLAPLLLSILFLVVSPREARVVMTGRVRVTTMLFLTVVAPAIWFFDHAAYRITKRLTESARLKLENDILQMERKRYSELRQYMEETRVLRHDFRQHLNVLGELYRSGQTEKFAAYLGDYTKNISDSRTQYCLNQSVDALAAWYDSAAANQDSRITYDLELPRELPVLETDYCAIFGNLVENALTAVKTLPPEKRRISVVSKMISDEMLGLVVENPYEGTLPMKEDGLPASARKNHGIGLLSVKNTAGKYQGSLDIQTADGLFRATVLLYKI